MSVKHYWREPAIKRILLHFLVVFVICLVLMIVFYVLNQSTQKNHIDLQADFQAAEEKKRVLQQQIDKSEMLRATFLLLQQKNMWASLEKKSGQKKIDREALADHLNTLIKRFPDIQVNVVLGKLNTYDASKNQEALLSIDGIQKNKFFAYEFDLVADVLHEERLLALVNTLEHEMPGLLWWQGCNLSRNHTSVTTADASYTLTLKLRCHLLLLFGVGEK